MFAFQELLAHVHDPNISVSGNHHHSLEHARILRTTLIEGTLCFSHHVAFDKSKNRTVYCNCNCVALLYITDFGTQTSLEMELLPKYVKGWKYVGRYLLRFIRQRARLLGTLQCSCMHDSKTNTSIANTVALAPPTAAGEAGSQSQ